jgi:hypothetical protein
MTHLKIVIGGQLIESQGWSIGITTRAPSGFSPSDLATGAQQAYADFLSAAWSTAASGTVPLSSFIGTAGNVAGAKVYFYSTGATQALGVGASSGAAVAGTNTVSSPPQCALVASLLSGYGGRDNRGRIYVPHVGRAVGTTGRSNVVPVQFATTIANWLSLMRTRSINGQPTIPIIGSANGAGLDITQVRADNVVDTQRRRRDKISPTLTGSANLIVG